MTGFTIRPLAAGDCAAVAQLHMRCLPTSFRGTVGVRLLGCYYEAVAQGNGACGYVACPGDRLAGYVCGVWDAGAVHAVLLRRYGIKLAWWGMLHALAQPRTLPDLRQRIKRGRTGDGAWDFGYELRPIVVAPEYRGAGVANILVETLLADARRRGYADIHLLAYGSDGRALRFYHKAGFHEAAQCERQGTHYVRFVRETTNAR